MKFEISIDAPQFVPEKSNKVFLFIKFLSEISLSSMSFATKLGALVETSNGFTLFLSKYFRAYFSCGRELKFISFLENL